MAHERIRLTPSGQVLLELRHRWADGTMHLHPTARSPRGGGPGLLFEPIELLERLAALTPRPRINLVLYYGVLGAHAAWRSRLGGSVTVEPSRSTVAASMDPEAAAVPAPPPAAAPAAPLPESTAPMAREANVLWARLMQRSFPPPPRLRRGPGRALCAWAGGFDVLACPRCGGRLRLIALIENPVVIRRILGHLGLPTDVPARRPSRAPPLPLERMDEDRVEEHLAATADRVHRRGEDDLAIP